MSRGRVEPEHVFQIYNKLCSILCLEESSTDMNKNSEYPQCWKQFIRRNLVVPLAVMSCLNICVALIY